MVIPLQVTDLARFREQKTDVYHSKWPIKSISFKLAKGYTSILPCMQLSPSFWNKVKRRTWSDNWWMVSWVHIIFQLHKQRMDVHGASQPSHNWFYSELSRWLGTRNCEVNYLTTGVKASILCRSCLIVCALTVLCVMVHSLIFPYKPNMVSSVQNCYAYYNMHLARSVWLWPVTDPHLMPELCLMHAEQWHRRCIFNSRGANNSGCAI